MISLEVTRVHANTINNNTRNSIGSSSSNNSYNCNSTFLISRSSTCSTQRSRRGEKVEHHIIATSETTPTVATITTRKRSMDETITGKTPTTEQLPSPSSSPQDFTSRRLRKRLPPPPPPHEQHEQQLVDTESPASASAAEVAADTVSRPDSLSFRDQSNEPVATRKQRKKRKESFKVPETLLGRNYKPKPNDVICQRGHEAKNWPGNKTFRHLIETNLETYRAATTKKEKTTIVSTIIDSIRSTSPPGKFIRKSQNQNNQNRQNDDDGDSQWYETGDDFAREKIGQGFRDNLHTEYKSSSKAKISRRKESTKLEQEFEEFIESDPSDDPLLGRLTSTMKKAPSQPSTKIKKKKKMEKRFSLSTTPISAPAIPYKRTRVSTNVTAATTATGMTNRRTPNQFANDGSAASLPYGSLSETTTITGGGRVYPQQQYRQGQQHPQRTPGAFPYPPSFVGGFSNDGRQRILLGSDVPVQFDPRSSPSSFDPSSGENTAFRDRMMMMMAQPPGHNFNSFSDLSLSSHPPERNVGIYDMDPIQNQRLLGRDRIPAPPIYPQHQQTVGSTLSSSHRRQQSSPKDAGGVGRYAFHATSETAAGKATSFPQQVSHLSRYSQTPQQMQAQQQQLLQRQQQVFFDLQQRNATTTTTATTTTIPQGSNEESSPQLPPSLDISSKSRIQDDEPLPWKEDPES